MNFLPFRYTGGSNQNITDANIPNYIRMTIPRAQATSVWERPFLIIAFSQWNGERNNFSYEWVASAEAGDYECWLRWWT